MRECVTPAHTLGSHVRSHSEVPHAPAHSARVPLTLRSHFSHTFCCVLQQNSASRGVSGSVSGSVRKVRAECERDRDASPSPPLPQLPPLPSDSSRPHTFAHTLLTLPLTLNLTLPLTLRIPAHTQPHRNSSFGLSRRFQASRAQHSSYAGPGRRP